MATIKKTPAIRFKGFEEEWEEKKLGEIGGFKNGMNFGKEAMGHGFPFVNLENVFGKNTVDTSNLGFAESSENQRKDYNLITGDVLFIRSSVKPEGVGEAAVIVSDLINTTFSGFIIRFRPTINLDVNFNRFVFSVDSSRKQILANATSSANTNINQNSLQKIKVSLPIVEEQTPIGNYFKELDGLIQLQAQKLEKVAQLKKAMLEKMFPKENADVPEIRFKGFTEKWEKRTLGQVFDFDIPTNTLSRALLNDKKGIIKNIHYGDILIKYNSYLNVSKESIPYITKGSVSDFKNCYLKDGDIIFADAAEDETVGKCIEICNVEVDYLVSGLHTIAARPLYKFERYYLGYYLNSKAYHNQLVSLMQGTKVSSISKTNLKKTILLYPSKEKEQQKIGDYFQSLDQLISQSQKKIQQLKHLKQALLQKMFI